MLEAVRTVARYLRKCNGETAAAFYVVRESITRTVDWEEQWEFGTDDAVVFELPTGSVCISKSWTAPSN